MKAIIELRDRSQITLPKEVIKAMGLQKGDQLEISVEEDVIKIRPVIIVPKAETWFWSKEWQEGEKKVDEEIRRGGIKGYDNIADLLEELDK